jgi:hypothetical protein
MELEPLRFARALGRALPLAWGLALWSCRAGSSSAPEASAPREQPSEGAAPAVTPASTSGAPTTPSGGVGSPADGTAPAGPAVDAGAQPVRRCVVFLHGKGGAGGPSLPAEGYLRVAPVGNADGWGGKQWLYFPDARFAEVRAIVASALDGAGCTRALVHGFSNGGAAAAKLYCRGDSFGGRVQAYVFDDPVPDHGADACTPPAGTQATLYWTGALGQAAAGWSCAEGDWTCEGGSTIGVQRYAQNLGLAVGKSIHTSHTPYENPPEYQGF